MTCKHCDNIGLCLQGSCQGIVAKCILDRVRINGERIPNTKLCGVNSSAAYDEGCFCDSCCAKCAISKGSCCCCWGQNTRTSSQLVEVMPVWACCDYQRGLGSADTPAMTTITNVFPQPVIMGGTNGNK